MSKKVDTLDFVMRSQKVHTLRYDYSKTIYKKAKLPVEIICKTHGSFFQTPDVHVRGVGCPFCGGSHVGTTDSFITKAEVIYGDKYDYSEVEYVRAHSHVKIRCRKCDILFMKTPTHHLSGQGCPSCTNKVKGTTKSFIEKANILYGERYDYSRVNYRKRDIKVTIFCKLHDAYFEKTPANHLKGQGCPLCASSGFKVNQPAILYYIKVSERAYKIGITNRTVKLRFNTIDRLNIKLIKSWSFESGIDALKEETKIMKRYKEYKYIGPNLLSSGNTELFNIDILGLDNEA